jgi:hypothetical protein
MTLPAPLSRNFGDAVYPFYQNVMEHQLAYFIPNILSNNAPNLPQLYQFLNKRELWPGTEHDHTQFYNFRSNISYKAYNV